MIFVVIAFFIIGYSLVNYKKSFMLYLCYKTILVTNINILSIPGLPMLTVDMFISLFYALMYFGFGKRKRYKETKTVFPFKIPMCLFVFSWTVSSLFSVAGIGSEISAFVGNVSQDVLLIWMLWEMIETKEDFIFLFKGFTIAFLICCLYGLVEYILRSNPIVDYEKTLVKDPTKVIDFSYSTDQRGYRVQSLFEHAIGAGINWAMFAIFVFTAIIRYNEKIPRRSIAVVTAVLSIICIILTKMRGPIIFFVIAAFSLFEPKKKKFFILMGSAVIGVLLAWPFISDNLVVIQSFFSKQAQSTVGGSNIAQRTGQLQAALHLMVQSPFWGLGEKFLSVMDSFYTKELLGLESVWFSTMTKYGAIGLVANICMAYSQIIKLPRMYHSKPLFFFSLAYWLTATVTSVPGMLLYVYYLIMFYYIKKSTRYQFAPMVLLQNYIPV